MRIQTLTIVLFLLSALVATAETVVVDARLTTPSEGALAQRHLSVVEGAAMEPFFDSGHIVFDSPADQASTLGASLVLRVFLELAVVEDSLVPVGLRYEFYGVAEDAIYAAGVIDSDPDSEQTVDQRLILLGTAATEQALATWMQL